MDKAFFYDIGIIRNSIRLPIAPQGRCNKMLLSLIRLNRHNMVYILARLTFIKLPINLTKTENGAPRHQTTVMGRYHKKSLIW